MGEIMKEKYGKPLRDIKLWPEGLIAARAAHAAGSGYL